MNRLKRLYHWLNTPQDAALLGTLRILFGGALTWAVLRMWYWDIVHIHFRTPKFHLPFFEVPFSYYPNGLALFLPFILLPIAGIGIALGKKYRLSCWVYFVCWSFVVSIDKFYFSFDSYLVWIVSFYLAITSGNAIWSGDASKKSTSPVVPRWQYGLFQAQFLIIATAQLSAKFTGAWFSGEVLKTILAMPNRNPIISPVTSSSAFLIPASYLLAGIHIAIVVGLFFKRTRWLSVLAYSIGMTAQYVFFPSTFYVSARTFMVLMMVLSLSVLDPSWPRKAFDAVTVILRRVRDAAPSGSSSFKLSPITVLFLVVFCVAQIVMPLRHLVVPGDHTWTGQGHYFAWTMKLMSGETLLRVFVTAPQSGLKWEETVTSAGLRRQIGFSPKAIYDYVQHLKTKYEKIGYKDPIITVEAYKKLGEREYRYLIDPTVDLAKVRTYYYYRRNPWVYPLEDAPPVPKDKIEAARSLYEAKRHFTTNTP